MMRTFSTLLFTGSVLALAACGPAPSGNDMSSVNSSYAGQPMDPSVTLADNLLATNYYVLLDNSGSMDGGRCAPRGETKFSAAKAALTNFVSSLPSDTNVAFAVFAGTSATTVVSFGSGDNHRQRVYDAIDMARSDEGTPLSGSLAYARKEMGRQLQAQAGYGVHRMVVVTDGESMDGNPGPRAQGIVTETPIEVHAIGFCTGSGHSLNVQGYTAFYTADDPTQLAAGLKATQAEVTSFDVTKFGN